MSHHSTTERIEKPHKGESKLHFQRYEFKYHIPIHLADKILPGLLNYMDFDEHIETGQNFYDVHSVYLDSPNFKNYHEKIEGELFRKKLRVRTYSKDPKKDTNVFVEIKRKYDAVIIKDRTVMTLEAATSLCHGKIDYDLLRSENHAVIDEFLQDKMMYAMRPKVLVSYKRKPLVSRNGMNLRVTFDYDIEALRVSNVDFSKATKPIFPGMCVLEIKFNDMLPYWLHSVIQNYKLEAWPYSKYCFGVENSYLIERMMNPSSEG
ncbi:MAG: polyphosphate polymerase domain-containing protein [Candidatus Peregrinibacteria bacterium]|nr:polyphosphate polymerase domain-containing protein [Candidatus Peregrinibacteria bacterium]MDZ4245459.1 polyphosphate polymerase domain-containing protein [Candidatus Gracilibacteria bacterium]